MHGVLFALLMAVAPGGVDPATAPQLSGNSKILLGKCLSSADAAAEAACTELIGQDDQNNAIHSLVYTARAYIHLQKADLDGTLADADQAIALDGQNAMAYLMRGNVYRIQHKASAALDDANASLKIKEAGPAYLLRASAEAMLGQMQPMMDDAEKAVALLPDNADAYMARGSAYVATGKLEPAIADLTKALSLKPAGDRLALLYELRGAAYRASNHYDEALADANQEIAAAPKESAGYISRGTTYLMHNLNDEAIADFELGLTLSPGAARLLELRGFAKRRKGDLDGALADYNESIRQNPKSAETYAGRAELNFSRKQFEEAAADFTSAIALDDNAQYHARRGLAYAELNRYQDALLDADKAVAQVNSRANLLVRGFFHEKLGERDAAIADFRASLKLPGTDEAQKADLEGLARLGATP